MICTSEEPNRDEWKFLFMEVLVEERIKERMLKLDDFILQLLMN